MNRRHCLALWPVALGLPRAQADERHVRVALAERLEPLCWEEQGRARGVQVEIAEQALARLGLTAAFQVLPWSRAQQRIEVGEADLMMTTPTEKRFAYAAFGREMTTPNYWNAFVPRTLPEVLLQVRRARSLADLRPLDLVDFLGNGWSDLYMNASDGFRVQRVPTLEDLVRMLSAGRAQAAVNSSLAVNWFLRKLSLEGALVEVPLRMPNTRFHMNFQVSRRSPWMARGLVRGLDTALARMKASGEWLAILARYGDPYARNEPFESTLNTEAFYRDYARYPDFAGRVR